MDLIFIHNYNYAGLKQICGEINDFVQVSKVASNLKVASSIQLILGGPQRLDFNTELYNRISKSHIGHILTKENQISIMFYGKMLKFKIKGITSRETISDLEDSFKNINFDENSYEFYKINESTKWQIYK